MSRLDEPVMNVSPSNRLIGQVGNVPRPSQTATGALMAGHGL